MSKPVHDLLEALDRIDPPDLWESITASAEAATGQEPDDDLTIFDLRGTDASPEPRHRKRRALVLAVAAAILVVVGVVVVADRNDNNVETEPVTSATTPDAVPSPTTPEVGPPPSVVDSLGHRWSRVPHNESVFADVVPFTAGMTDVVLAGPGLLAVGQGDGAQPTTEDPGDIAAAVWTSGDGITWSRIPHDEEIFGGAGSQLMTSVTAGGPGLVAVGSGDDDAAVWTSPDGSAWSRVPHNEEIFGGAVMNSVTAGGPGLVAVGSGDDDAAVWTSPDGSAWSRVPHNEAVFGGENEQLMNAVTVGGPGLVAVGRDGFWDWTPESPDYDTASRAAAVWTSADGVTWSRVAHNEAAFGGAQDQAMSSVTSVRSGLVAVGRIWAPSVDDSAAAVWTSPDGITWSGPQYDEAVFGSESNQSIRLTDGPVFTENRQFMNAVVLKGSDVVAVGADWSGYAHGAAVWTGLSGQ